MYNTGKGIPVQIHSKEKIYIPELIFGNLLTGANFNDDDKKVRQHARDWRQAHAGGSYRLFPPQPFICFVHISYMAQVVGGRNGYGAKLCNIFSTKFTIETCDTSVSL